MTVTMFPTIHLNGTSKQALSAQWEAVVRATEAAYDALSAAMPNGRDYYPQGDGALATATVENRVRMETLRAIYRDAEKIYNRINGLDE